MEQIQYFHLSPDDKFVDYVIDNCETIAKGENVYVVRNEKEENAFVKSKRVINVKTLKDALNTLYSYPNIKYVYIHLLTNLAIDFVLNLPKEVKVIWVFWGADGYMLPKLKSFQYLPLTQDIVNTYQRKPNIFQKIKRVVLPIEAKLIKAVKRADYCATWVEKDFYLIKSYNKNIKFLFFANNSIEQLLEDQLEFNLRENKRLYIYVGNSGNPSNNHVEIFEMLKDESSFDVVVPLSYGTQKYIRAIDRIAGEMLKDSYQPVMDFMPKDQYHELLLNAHCIVMNHTRQQAANNTLAALWHSVPLFMNKNSTLYQTYKSWGLDIGEIDEIPKFLSHGTTAVNGDKNRNILKNKLGQNAVLSYYKAFLFKKDLT